VNDSVHTLARAFDFVIKDGQRYDSPSQLRRALLQLEVAGMSGPVSFTENLDRDWTLASVHCLRFDMAAALKFLESGRTQDDAFQRAFLTVADRDPRSGEWRRNSAVWDSRQGSNHDCRDYTKIIFICSMMCFACAYCALNWHGFLRLCLLFPIRYFLPQWRREVLRLCVVLLAFACAYALSEVLWMTGDLLTLHRVIKISILRGAIKTLLLLVVCFIGGLIYNVLIRRKYGFWICLFIQRYGEHSQEDSTPRAKDDQSTRPHSLGWMWFKPSKQNALLQLAKCALPSLYLRQYEFIELLYFRSNPRAEVVEVEIVFRIEVRGVRKDTKHDLKRGNCLKIWASKRGILQNSIEPWCCKSGPCLAPCARECMLQVNKCCIHACYKLIR
jgi:hypothetical protein